jgi:hypothetical protein
MARKNSQMKEIVRESMEELRNGEFPEDPKLAEQLSGPERFEHNQKRKDEVVIDTLFADISGKTGYFVKLKKEVRPNEYMLMKVIENDWRKWPDIETEVRNIVVEHTKINSVKWGTGAYRLEVACKAGMRGKGYDPIDLYINAEEEFNTPQVQGAGVMGHTDPNVAVASKLEELRTLVDVIGGIVPKPQDPAMVQTQIAQAFQQGMQMKSNESTGMTSVMSTMMTSMVGLVTAMMTNNRASEVPRIVNPEETLSKTIGMLKDVGAFGAKEQQKTIVDFAKELQALGIDLFKKDDPMEQINKLKQMAGIASQFMGMGGEGEKPSWLERIVDVLGPSIPKMISDFKSATENAAKVQMIAGQNIRNAQIPMAASTAIPNAPAESSTMEPTTYQRMGGGDVNPVPTQPAPQNAGQTDQVKAFFAQLYESVKNNNRMFFPVIYTSMLQDQSGIALVQGIAQGTHNAKHLIDMLQQHGDERFRESEFVMKSLVPYVNGFIMWVQQMAGVNREEMPVAENARRQMTNVRQKEEFDVVCGTCRTVFSYPNETAFMTDLEKNCGEEGCHGFLEPYVKAS